MEVYNSKSYQGMTKIFIDFIATFVVTYCMTQKRMVGYKVDHLKKHETYRAERSLINVLK